MITDNTEIWYMIRLPLYNNKNYYNDITIDGISCRFTFEYNERISTRYLSIVTASGTVLLSKTPIFLDNEIYLDTNADLIGIHDCFIKLIKVNSTNNDDLLNWQNDYVLFIKGVYDDIYNDYYDFKKSLIV